MTMEFDLIVEENYREIEFINKWTKSFWTVKA